MYFDVQKIVSIFAEIKQVLLFASQYSLKISVIMENIDELLEEELRDVRNDLEDYLDMLEREGQSVILSIHALENTYNFLVDKCCDGLAKVQAQMTGFVESMRGAGVPTELCQRLSDEYFKTDFENFENIYSRIVENDLKFLENAIEAQENTLRCINGETVDVDLHQPGVKQFSYQGLGSVEQNEQVLSLQKRACGKTISYLRNRREQLAKLMNIYEEYCNAMRAGGVPVEYHEEYVHNYAGVISEGLEDIMSHLRVDSEYLTEVYNSMQ